MVLLPYVHSKDHKKHSCALLAKQLFLGGYYDWRGALNKVNLNST